MLTAPLVGECPSSLIVEVDQIIDNKTNLCILANVVETIVAKDIMKEGSTNVELEKFNPALFSFAGPSYFGVSERSGIPWKADPYDGIDSPPPLNG
ncbi:hypothetical protein KIPB_012088 [Kipferlia bialata]|uniref:Uncharacterized protein n=1 Tax=Kipferlia bialata TaxID=797122 RepID=A0A9K3D8Z9_9EUKA|nr:hypothetical protein KIPB_012088 [Kipferlia bialata]|eukprot:g12088.t1